MTSNSPWSALVRVTPVHEYAHCAGYSAYAPGAGGTTLDALRHLTPRQREVLAVMMEGKCNKAICRILNVAEPTVKNHVTAILRALHAANRTEAVIKVAKASVPAPYVYTISAYGGQPAYT